MNDKEGVMLWEYGEHRRLCERRKYLLLVSLRQVPVHDYMRGVRCEMCVFLLYSCWINCQFLDAHRLNFNTTCLVYVLVIFRTIAIMINNSTMPCSLFLEKCLFWFHAMPVAKNGISLCSQFSEKCVFWFHVKPETMCLTSPSSVFLENRQVMQSLQQRIHPGSWLPVCIPFPSHTSNSKSPLFYYRTCFGYDI